MSKCLDDLAAEEKREKEAPEATPADDTAQEPLPSEATTTEAAAEPAPLEVPKAPPRVTSD